MGRKRLKTVTLDDFYQESAQANSKDLKINEDGCKICGGPIADDTFKRCRMCLNKLALIDDMKELLEYVSPGESFREIDLINKGYKSLKLNLLISKFLRERLIVLNTEGYFTLNSIEFLNSFIDKYGENEEPLRIEDYEEIDHSNYLYIDINNYSDHVRIRFNPRIGKWVLDFYNNKSLIHSKSFHSSEEANKEAIYYIKQLGVSSRKKKDEEDGNKRRFSSYEGIYYSPSRDKWGAKVKGYKGSKFIGHFDTEEEAYQAKLQYLENKERTRENFIDEKRGIKSRKIGNSSGEGIYFSRQRGKWIVRLQDDFGKYHNIGEYDSEEEANAAKEDFILNNGFEELLAEEARKAEEEALEAEDADLESEE